MTYDLKTLRVSHSSLSMFRSCARKFEFRKMYTSNLREESFAAKIGTALHIGFQHYLMHKDEEAALWEMMLNYPVEMVYDKQYDSNRQLDACYASLMALIHNAAMSDWELIDVIDLDGNSRPAIEVPFELQILDFSLDGEFNEDGTPHIPVVLTGFMDAIMHNKEENKYRVFDAKTHRLSAENLAPKYEFDEQQVPYGIILEHQLGHTIDGFEVTYLSQYIDTLQPFTEPYTFYKNRELLEDWVRNLYFTLKQMSEFYKLEWWPRASSGDSCFAYQKPCIFWQYCNERSPEKIRRLLDPRKTGSHMQEPEITKPWVIVPFRFFNEGETK